jgi:hypothetical protein
VVAVITTSFATAPGRSWGGAVRTIVAMVLTAIVVLAWQLASTGPLDTAALARSVSSPVVVLLPPALAFVAALHCWRRRCRHCSARSPVGSRRAPLALRLSLLSLSRDPGRPRAATLTLLAFSIGAIVFATCWSATLRGRYRRCGLPTARGWTCVSPSSATGLSIAPSVVPVDRYAKLGAGM